VVWKIVSCRIDGEKCNCGLAYRISRGRLLYESVIAMENQGFKYIMLISLIIGYVTIFLLSYVTEYLFKLCRSVFYSVCSLLPPVCLSLKAALVFESFIADRSIPVSISLALLGVTNLLRLW